VEPCVGAADGHVAPPSLKLEADVGAARGCRYTEHGYSIFYLSFSVLTVIAALKARAEKSITALDTVHQH
jgi:hypothetical protein